MKLKQDIANLTPYQDINDILVLMSEELNDILGKKLLGFYLTGSLTYGDFKPDRSDIDLLVVVENQLSQDEIIRVKKMHEKIKQFYKSWKERIECSYLPVNLLSNILPPKQPRPYVGGGIFYPKAQYGNEWLINNYFLYHYGIAIMGPDFKELIQPINIVDIQKASARDLFKEWEPKINDPVWLKNSHYQSYLILNLCRILYTVVAGKLGSKKVSCKWVKNQYPQWKDLIKKAENWHYGIEMQEQEQSVEFIKFTIGEVNNHIQV
jgi:predicted nucleotidyltransferase